MTKQDLKKYVVYAFVLLLILLYARPRSFYSVMPDFEKADIVSCDAVYFSTDFDENGNFVDNTRNVEFDVNSEEYKELLSLLKSAKYRKHFVDFFIGGNIGSYSINLNPHAQIYFYAEKERYEISLLGRWIVAGKIGEKYDYSAYFNGKKFQKKVIEFVGEKGTEKE